MMRAPPRSLLREDPASQTVDYVTIIVAAQRFGLPIACVHDVFMAGAITPVPLAPPEVSGLLNLRGRVVTALSMRRLLRLPDLPPGEDRMVVGVEHAGESADSAEHLGPVRRAHGGLHEFDCEITGGSVDAGLSIGIGGGGCHPYSLPGRARHEGRGCTRRMPPRRTLIHRTC